MADTKHLNVLLLPFSFSFYSLHFIHILFAFNIFINIEHTPKCFFWVCTFMHLKFGMFYGTRHYKNSLLVVIMQLVSARNLKTIAFQFPEKLIHFRGKTTLFT